MKIQISPVVFSNDELIPMIQESIRPPQLTLIGQNTLSMAQHDWVKETNPAIAVNCSTVFVSKCVPLLKYQFKIIENALSLAFSSESIKTFCNLFVRFWALHKLSRHLSKNDGSFWPMHME